MFPNQYFKSVAMLSIYFQISYELHKVSNVNLPECFQNPNIWKIYSDHFIFADNIRLKILATNQDEDDITDITAVILDNVLSVMPIKTVEIQKNKTKAKVPIKTNNPTVLIERNRRKYYFSSNKYNIFKYSSNPEEAYMIVAWNEEVIYQHLYEMPDFLLPKSRALYIILLTFQQKDLCTDFSQEIGLMLKLMWEKFNILNIIVQAPCSCNSDYIYIYHPFTHIGKNRGSVKINEIQQILYDQNLIVNQLRNMNGYPLNVSLFERKPTTMPFIASVLENYSIYKYAKEMTGYYGMDANILTELSNVLNFKIQLDGNKNSYYGKVLQNGTITDSLGQVVRREVQLSANGRFVGDYGTSGIEFTNVFSSDQICLIVPKAKRKPQWMAIFYCFELSVWLLIITVLLATSTVWYFHQRMLYKNPDICKVFLDLFSICFSIPVKISLKEIRIILLGTLMLFNVVMNGIFQGNLIKSFSKSVYYPDMNTLQDVADSNLRISTSLDIFTDNNSEIFRKLHEKTENSIDNTSAMDKAAYLKKWVAIERKSDARFLLKTNYTNENGEELLHIVSDCPYSTFIAYIVPRGSPLLPEFNYIIQMFLEGGLILKWNEDIEEAITIEKYVNTKYTDRVLRILTVDDLKCAFLVLITGYLTSMSVFFIEIYW